MTGARSKDKILNVANAQDLAASAKDNLNPLAINPASGFDQTKLQFFYENGQVAGFGWLNDNYLCYGQYSDSTGT